MARSNKPVIWLPFAAGGTIAAFVMPAVMLVLLLGTLGLLPEEALAFERISRFLGNPLVMIVVLLLLGLPLWHAAHRFRMTVQDLGVRGRTGRRILARFSYIFAALATLALTLALLINVFTSGS